MGSSVYSRSQLALCGVQTVKEPLHVTKLWEKYAILKRDSQIAERFCNFWFLVTFRSRDLHDRRFGLFHSALRLSTFKLTFQVFRGLVAQPSQSLKHFFPAVSQDQQPKLKFKELVAHAVTIPIRPKISSAKRWNPWTTSLRV